MMATFPGRPVTRTTPPGTRVTYPACSRANPSSILSVNCAGSSKILVIIPSVLLRGISAVHQDFRAVDHVRPVRCQEHGRRRYLLRRGEAADRDQRAHGVAL